MKTMILNGSPRRNWNTVFFGREPEQKKPRRRARQRVLFLFYFSNGSVFP